MELRDRRDKVTEAHKGLRKLQGLAPFERQGKSLHTGQKGLGKIEQVSLGKGDKERS